MADRMSEEYGCKVGDYIGCRCKVVNLVSKSETKIVVLTDGKLLLYATIRSLANPIRLIGRNCEKRQQAQGLRHHHHR
jgi:hypothetical protein